jgi:hypothetical protein
MILWFGGVQGSNMCSFILITIMLKKVLTQGNPNTGACAWENSRCESERERERESYRMHWFYTLRVLQSTLRYWHLVIDWQAFRD